MKNKLFAGMMGFAAVSACLFLSGCGNAFQASSLEAGVPTLNVQGEGKIEAVPDEALVRFGVTSDEKTLAKAYEDNSQKMNLVIDVLKKDGIESRDIKTSSYTVSPIYPRDETGRQLPGKPSAFRVSQELSVKVRDTSATGRIIDKVISGGVNTFSGIQFSSSRMDELETEARVKAAKDAGSKASALAEAMGVKLGRLIRVSQSSYRPYPVNKMLAYDMSMARSAVPQVEAGSMEVTATCDAVYEIIQ
ncbi:MAG TPA: SIMPL domain-containing protein [Candidatus Omnitrophota bacterium]|nr:SIMPL domain-containing protein [Candidatus Omnitrophota bacterium]